MHDDYKLLLCACFFPSKLFLYVRLKHTLYIDALNNANSFLHVQGNLACNQLVFFIISGRDLKHSHFDEFVQYAISCYVNKLRVFLFLQSYMMTRYLNHLLTAHSHKFSNNHLCLW